MNKNSILAIIFLILSALNTHAQWVRQNSNTNNNLTKVTFLNVNTGIAVGENGTAVKTTNGGATWHIMQTNVTENINECLLLNANTGFLLTYRKLLKTTNGGNNWNVIWDNGGDSTFYTINFFKNSTTGFLFGPCLAFKTTNTGLTWNSIYTCPIQYGGKVSFQCSALSNDTLIILGGQISVEHSNPASCFGYISPSSNLYISGSYRSGSNVGWIRFAGNSGIGYGVESGYYLTTTSYGIGWGEYTPPFLWGKPSFYNDTLGFNLQLYNVFRYSTNSGNTWLLYDTLKDTPLLFDLQMLNPNVVTSVGDSGTIVRNSNFIISVTAISTEIPDKFALLQNYPNPFNPSTVISFSLPRASDVTIEVYTSLGTLIKTLATGSYPAGNHSIRFNSGSLSSGVYFYKLRAGDFTQTKSMILIK